MQSPEFVAAGAAAVVDKLASGLSTGVAKDLGLTSGAVAVALAATQAPQRMDPDPSSTLQILAIVVLFTLPGLALIAVIARGAARMATRQFGIDDWLIAVAMVFSAGETFASYKFIKTNFIGIPGRLVPPHDQTEPLIWTYIVEILYNPILALVKASVLIFLLRLFGQKTGVRKYILVVNTANVLQMVAVFFAIIFQCFPIEANWRPEIKGRCIDQRILFTSTASFTILTDILVLALPAYIFHDLKIPRKTKMALLVVFLLGVFVTIAGIVRLVFLVQGLFRLVTLPDPTNNIGFITSAIETNLALITASAPALMPLLKSWFPSVFGQDQPTRSPAAAGIKSMKSVRSMKSTIELRGRTPRMSEEEAMTYNGIVRQSQLDSRYEPRYTPREPYGPNGRF